MQRLTLLLISLFVVACGEVTAPRRDTGKFSPDYVCSNALIPAGQFRIIFSPDGTLIDTTAVYANRYLEPHRFRDTVTTTTNQGGALLFIFGPTTDTSSACVTVYDSLLHHAPNVRGAIGA